VGGWANALEIYPKSVEKFSLPCHFGQNRNHNQGSRWKGKPHPPLTPIIRAAQNFRWWIWDVLDILTFSLFSANRS
jgi:hypothetical protein